MVALIVFCFFLPDTNARRPVGLGSADLDLGAVQVDGEPFGCGVGQHVGQGVEALSGWGGEAAVGQQWPDLAYRGGHGGAVHAVEQGQGLVG